MNHREAKEGLFDTTFLLGGFRRRAALKWLLERGDAEAAGILIDAVARNHPQSSGIRRHLAAAADPGAVRRLVQAWRQSHPEWLGALAVERALSAGLAGELPLDRQTAWLVAAHVKGALAARAKAYVDRVIAEQPDFTVALLFKTGRALELERSRAAAAAALALLSDKDAEVRTGAETYLRDRLPNAEQYNDLLVDEWLRTQSPFLAKLVAEPRLPSNPAKEALIRLVNRDAAGYRKLADKNGALLAEALTLATPEMRKAINETILQARDGALSDAYRMAAAAAGGAAADPQAVLRALTDSGNEDGLVEATRTMTLAEVLPLCKRWAETGRRPNKEAYRDIVERAVRALSAMPKLEIEAAAPLPEGLEDLFEVWQKEKVPDDQLRQDLKAADPFVRARALFLGGERGLVDAAALRAKAASEDWPERLVAALRGARPENAGEDHVAWINTVAGLDADLLAAKIACGPNELQWSEGLCKTLRNARGPIAARNLALAETLAAFRSLYGGIIQVGDDDSAQKKEAVAVGAGEVADEELKF